MRKRRGVAMIVVLAMVIIFASLAIAVLLTAAISIRRAYAFRHRSVAVNLAELGVADALYKLNYRYHDNLHYYGFQPTGECLQDTAVVGQTYRYELAAGDLGYEQATPADKVTVGLSVTDAVNGDTLFAVAWYKGRSAEVSCNLRTRNTPTTLGWTLRPSNYSVPYSTTDPPYFDTRGTAEAFNKHVVYAWGVAGSGTTVSGNVAADTGVVVSWPLSSWTRARTVLPLLGNMSASLPSDPGPPYTDDYDNAGNRNGTPLPGNDGVYWDSANGIYHFGTNDGTGAAAYTRTANTVRITGARARLRFGAQVGNYFKVNDDVQIDSCIFVGSGQTCVDCAEILLTTGARIAGDLTVKRSAAGPLQLSAAGLRFTGALVCDEDVTISGSGIAFDLSGGTSSREAAVVIPSAGPRTLIVNASPAITLGSNQWAALIVSTPSAASAVTVAAAVEPVYDNVHQSAIVLYGNTASSLSVTAPVRGLVYSGGGVALGAGARLTGAVVSGYGAGTVALNGGTLSYDASAFRSLALPGVFRGFIGGRRVYLPVPGSWRIR